ncbi:unnamed protein product [Arctogadus glacialis]
MHRLWVQSCASPLGTPLYIEVVSEVLCLTSRYTALHRSEPGPPLTTLNEDLFPHGFYLCLRSGLTPEEGPFHNSVGPVYPAGPGLVRGPAGASLPGTSRSYCPNGRLFTATPSVSATASQLRESPWLHTGSAELQPGGRGVGVSEILKAN